MAKVAVVSSDKELANLVSGFLKEAGHRVTTFSEYNAEMAIKKAGGFGVIIMDDHKPGSKQFRNRL